MMPALKSFIIVSSALLPSALADYYNPPAASSAVSSIRGGTWLSSSAYPKPSGSYGYDDEDDWGCDDDEEDDGSYSVSVKAMPSYTPAPMSTYTTTTVEYVPCTAGQTITRDGNPWVAPEATTVTMTRTLTVTTGARPTGGSGSGAWGTGGGNGAPGSGGQPGSPSKPPGSSPSKPPSSGECSYYLEDIKHQGIAAFNSNPGSYVVFRDVKEFGAKGDGVTDDTEAINAAISSGDRCGPENCGPGTDTTTPAIVYFPPGTYVVSKPIVDYYYTQIIGNPNCLPVIKPSADFNGSYVLDGNPYQPGGNTAWGSTNVFWRQTRNLIFDFSSVPADTALAGVHWPTGQATSLQNLQFKLSSAAGTQHVGIFIESGSGGFMGDLSFTGGLYGLQVGNQQFTMRNLKFDGCVNAINQIWDWGWTYKSLSINNCQVGIAMGSRSTETGLLTVGSVVVVDSVFSNTPVGIATNRTSTDDAAEGGEAANSVILDNVKFNNVAQPVTGPGDVTVLADSSVNTWGQGHKYGPTGPQVFQGPFTSQGRSIEYVEKSKPQYENVPVSDFLSARDAGAKGDGKTDDTAALNAAISKAASSGLILFLDHGDYLVTDTIYVPPGAKIVGETYPVILSAGAKFSDISNPLPVVQIGKASESGSVELSDFIVSTAIINSVPQGGATLIEYNLKTTAGSGLWDVHTRVGGFAGSNLQVAQCVKQPGDATIHDQCIAAFMSLHITKSASGFYGENNWFWVADHDIEIPDLTQITVYAGRGMLVESEAGNSVLWGSSVEHHVLYEYAFVGTKDIVLGQLQTETAYYQPLPAAPAPFPIDARYSDPEVGASGWGLFVKDSWSVKVLGAVNGLSSFRRSYVC